MTRQRSFKSRVRTRMGKTGESYTAARRQVLAKAAPDVPTPPASPVPPASATPSAGVAALNVSDAAIRARTGRDWDEWFALLDDWGATEHTHTEITRWLMAEQGIENWSSQTIAVTYQQARGMREPGQNSRGEFHASASRTVAVAVDRLFAAFTDEALRAQWLPGVEIRERTSNPPRSLRVDWNGGPSRLAAGFESKGPDKATVSVLHEKLADAAAAGEMKAYWRARLAALKALLEA